MKSLLKSVKVCVYVGPCGSMCVCDFHFSRIHVLLSTVLECLGKKVKLGLAYAQFPFFHLREIVVWLFAMDDLPPSLPPPPNTHTYTYKHAFFLLFFFIVLHELFLRECGALQGDNGKYSALFPLIASIPSSPISPTCIFLHIPYRRIHMFCHFPSIFFSVLFPFRSY